MDDLIRPIANQAAKRMAGLYDDIIRGILDKALGPDGWTMADVPQLGQILQNPEGVTWVVWDGRHLATIRLHEERKESTDPFTLRWERTYRVEQHVVRPPG